MKRQFFELSVDTVTSEEEGVIIRLQGPYSPGDDLRDTVLIHVDQVDSVIQALVEAKEEILSSRKP